MRENKAFEYLHALSKNVNRYTTSGRVCRAAN